MTTATTRSLSRRGAGGGTDSASVNSVQLFGRLSSVPEERELPSGDKVVTFRLVMDRGGAATPMTAKSKQQSDWVDCAAWTAKLRRSALTWQVGDLIQVSGCLRRRFYRGAAGASSRVEVEVRSGRRSQRGAASRD